MAGPGHSVPSHENPVVIGPDAAVFPAVPPLQARSLLDVLDATTWACPGAAALDDGRVVLDYLGLRNEVRLLGRRLRDAGIGVGDRVGIRVPSGTADLYLCILAVLSAGAAYVPVDVDDPDERAELVWSEAGVCAVFGAGRSLTLRPGRRPQGRFRPTTPDDDAWIIFTSGSTGTPKGVAVTHRSAAAFVDAEARLFLRGRPLGPGDRVLAGLSVAFDASCEEMWLAWRHGACLVPAPRAVVKAGPELGDWLVQRGITVVSTVPTLVALWPTSALDRVRLLILGGEACPNELATRLADGRREVWNTYGPTEATVVTTAALMTGRDEVRIGLPLAGWTATVVDTRGDPVRWGETGELVIGGVGLGRYLDPAKDAEKYAPLPSLGWARAYRSGDLVRADPRGLVFAGRADEQVKLSGRRIELGEVDAALQALPGVAAGAAAVRTTPAGTQLLVGYVVPAGPAFDQRRAEALLRERLPAAIVPRLAVVDALPTKTSGKVDRAALPWPLPSTGDDAGAAGLTGTAGWLARQWSELLGVPVRGPDSDFFADGGSSLAAAKLVSVLRGRFPGTSVADVYRRPTLAALAARLDELGEGGAGRRQVRPVPRSTALVQSIILLVLFTITGLRWITGLALVSNLIGLVRPAPWAPYTSWWFVGIAGALLLTPPGRLVITVAGVRALCRGLRAGSHPRGGGTHLRLWTAERVAAVFGMASLTGTPWAARYARALGCRVGRNVALHALPPVTGLAVFGDGATVESEADVAGWWLDGDLLHLGEISIGPDARVGTRSTLLPGVTVGAGAEIGPGSGVGLDVPAGERWVGSPARHVGHAGASWPPPRPERSRRWDAAYAVSLFGLGLLPVLAAAPAGLLTYLLARNVTTLARGALVLLVSAPLSALLSFVSYALLVAVIVRLAGLAVTEGDHPADGRVGWCVWLIERLVGGARSTLFPLYASLLTPSWLRLLGARVGRRVEASTAIGLPGLMTVGDGGFLADDSMLAHHELRGGWLRVGRSEVGTRAFIGNSGIVGPGRAVPDGSLVGVLSEIPAGAAAGSSWLGRPAIELPRTADAVDLARTYAPPRRLVVARAAVEMLRLVPVTLTLLLAESVVGAFDEADAVMGTAATVGISGVLLIAAGVLACLVTSVAKWLLLGRIRVSEHPLWSSFVWRNELVDSFVEELAVPWLAGASLGTPLLPAWLRTMGTRVGRGVWLETYWLPEYDLISFGDGVTVNRGCVVQTHLFHDRLMRLDRVHLADGATLGPHSITLPGSEVGAMTTIGPSSLVMRGESVPAGTRWLGNPIAAWSTTATRSGGRRSPAGPQQGAARCRARTTGHEAPRPASSYAPAPRL
ncbi:Pls/PosA family non-ribosomal peptide synthetase [Pseudonocardia acidicola]|uniref:AMP-binding protein n=1 Tax=Pseudonocardia acidicola TaxID=2724939 RepID=A0ABX1SH78_9PSEU|nr:Pls/PosA family non-ribosomal peptide synthetase [Pseudonocardia acidicola]NMI00930.1 AMP-binding protein [Pseudonocardia acidicola]